jgi:hypothetical protein
LIGICVPCHSTGLGNADVVSDGISGRIEAASSVDVDSGGCERQRSIIPSKSNIIADFVICGENTGARSNHRDAARRKTRIDGGDRAMGRMCGFCCTGTRRDRVC